MLIRSTFSPLMRATMTMPGKRVLSYSFSRQQQHVQYPSLLLSRANASTKFGGLQRPHVLAALLTTQSNASPSHAAATSLRTLSLGKYNNNYNKYNRNNNPLWATTLTHQQLACFSSGGRGGAPSGPPSRGGRYGWAGGLLGAGALLVGKGKYLLGALKLTKLSSLASMFITVGAYTMVFGAPYAIGMVGLILVHESGHALVMRHYNIPFSPMVFLPFMGAVIAMKDHPKDAWQDAVIAFGGPALGSLGALGVAVGAQATDSQLLYALADFGFMVNLFNMMPIGDMDGGRIAGALSPYAGVVGLAMGGGLIYTGTIQNPIMYLVMLAGGYSTFQRFYDPAGHRPPHYYNITPAQRGILGGCYFGLIGALVAGMAFNSVNRKPPEELQRYKELHFRDGEFPAM